MLYESLVIKLKNNNEALFRSPKSSDAEEMLAFIRTLSSQTDFILSYPEEIKFSVSVK